MLIGDTDSNLIVAVTSFGLNSWCRGVDFSYRIDRTAVLDWSLQENVGFSAFISIGTLLDVGWGDLIDYLGNDPQTRSIVLYMESIGVARAFISAAREVALTWANFSSNLPEN